MSELDRIDHNYDAHLSAVDTRTANRLMALDPDERKVDELGVPLLHIGLGGMDEEGTPSTSASSIGQSETMQDRRDRVKPDEMRNVMDADPSRTT